MHVPQLFSYQIPQKRASSDRSIFSGTPFNLMCCPVRVLRSDCLADENRGPSHEHQTPTRLADIKVPLHAQTQTRQREAKRTEIRSHTFYRLFSLSGDILRLNTDIIRHSWRHRLKKQPLIIDIWTPAEEKGQRGSRSSKDSTQLLSSVPQPHT